MWCQWLWCCHRRSNNNQEQEPGNQAQQQQQHRKHQQLEYQRLRRIQEEEQAAIKFQRDVDALMEQVQDEIMLDLSVEITPISCSSDSKLQKASRVIESS